jgi:predicted ATPase
MITKWKLENFKAVVEATELDFAPLTVFAGPNSSGKSTWIQSILLVAQTLSSRLSQPPVLLNGVLTRLGEFRDLKSVGGKKREITIAFESKPSSEVLTEYMSEVDLETVSVEFSFDSGEPGGQPGLYEVQPRLCRSSLRCWTHVDEKTGRADKSHMEVRRRTDTGPTEDATRTVTTAAGSELGTGDINYDFEIELDGDSQHDLKEELSAASVVGCRFNHFLPYTLMVRFDQREEIAKAIATAVVDPGRYRRAPRHLSEKDLVLPASVIELIRDRVGDAGRDLLEPVLFSDAGPGSITARDWVDGLKRLQYSRRSEVQRSLQGLAQEIHDLVRSSRPPTTSTTAHRLPSESLFEGANYLDWVWPQMCRYLGPLRDEPKPLYPIVPSLDPSELGLRGEYTAAVIHQNKHRVVTYISSDGFREHGVRAAVEKGTLASAVQDWLKYLDIGSRLNTVDKGKLGHELRIEVPDVGGYHDLTHVGVGVSQVLPILVICFLAERDTTLIFEQPELHLHPKVQSRLGDFFLSMAVLGKQCVIETHSEYLINRLRLRSVQAEGDEIASLVRTYFVEMRGGRSTCRPVRINEYGAIQDWPEGFFDQSPREIEEIISAAAEKHHKSLSMREDK